MTTDAAGHDITTVVTVDPANKAVRTTVTAEAIGNAAYTETRNGYDALMQDTSGARVERTYDTSGRLQYVNSRWNGSSYLASDSYEYYGVTDYVTKMTVGGVPAQYSYAWGSTSSPGRTVTTTDADSKVSYVRYNAMELPLHLGGAAASPTAFDYDDLGRQTTMTTWRSGASFNETNWPASSTGDTTTWTLDPATGLLTQKKDAAGKIVDYTYTELGQVATRTWARYVSGSTTVRVKATYDYYSSGGTNTDVSYLTGELKGISYNDSLTPSVAFTYNRAGLLAGATDGVTGTHVFAYNPTNPSQLASETLAAFYGSRVQTRKYDTYGRATGFTLGTSAAPAADLSQIGTYHATTGLLDHLDTASEGGSPTTVQYGYESSSSLVDNYAIGSFSLSYDYDATSAARRSRIEGKFSTVTKTRFDLTYDSRGNLRTSKQSGTAFADYYPGAYSSVYNYHLYDERGQLKTSAMYGGTPPVSGAPASASFPGRRYEYRYDQAGNRTTVGQTGTDSDDQYETNSLNQYTTKENNDVHVLGTAAAGARVAMANATVAKVDRSFAADVAPGNSAGPKTGSLSVYSAVANPTPGGPDVVASQTKTWMVAKQLQAFTYDLDGNMTGDGVWTYAYDAENRLISMARTPAAVTAGLPDVRLEFKYDYMGRRVQKRSVLMAGTTVTQDVYTRYLYDGWNLVAEFAVTSGTTIGSLQRSYTWGLDLAGSTTATGGVGALVRIVDHTGTADAVYFPTYDGSGNVSALVAADGSLAAVYEYTAFGELQRAEGAYAAQNPFGFSTKFTDRESGLSYYGFRYYSPALGQFINRDPIGEKGGLNLYGFVGNNPTTRIDVLGLEGEKKECNSASKVNNLPHETCWWEGTNKSGDNNEGPSAVGTDNQGNPTDRSDVTAPPLVSPLTGDMVGDNAATFYPDGTISTVTYGHDQESESSYSPFDAIGSYNTQNAIDSVNAPNNAGSSFGNSLRSIPLIGGMLGAVGDIASGKIKHGLNSLSRILAADFKAQIVGSIGQEIAKRNAFNKLLAQPTLANLTNLALTSAIPGYGYFGGRGWGKDQWGESPQFAINFVDFNSARHDFQYGQPGYPFANADWVFNNYSPVPSDQIAPGPFGVAYVLTGTVPFLLTQ